MHDPMTVAFDIPSPIRHKPDKWCPKGYRPTLITIWHVDPQKDGADDSCDWSGRRRPLNPKEKVLLDAIFDYHIESVLDNPPHYPDSVEHEWYQSLKDAAYAWRRRERHWWQHPQWHIHHWRLQIHPWGTFYRWAFVRCEKCGGRFKWGASACGTSGSKVIWHVECDPHIIKGHND